MTHDKDRDKGHSLLKATGQLVRSSSSPHSMTWIPGMIYPANYYVRQTRSMTSRYQSLKDPVEPVCPVLQDTSPRGCRRVTLPSLKYPVDELDFYLPDKLFLHLKLAKLQSIQKQKQDKDRVIFTRHSPHSNKGVSISYTIHEECPSSNEMLTSHSSCISATNASSATHWYKKVSPMLSLTSYHCTYTQLNQSGCPITTTQLKCMGCLDIPIEVNNTFFDWVISSNGTQLLMVVNNNMVLFDSQGQCMTSFVLNDSILKHFKCLQLLQTRHSTSLAIIGGQECELWILSEITSPVHYTLFKETTPHQHVTGLHCMWETLDCNGVIATAFQLPSYSLWITSFSLDSSHQSLIINNQFNLPLPHNKEEEETTVITSLYFIPQSKYLLAISNELLIWDYVSAVLIKRVRLQCGPLTKEPLPAAIVHAFLECEEANDHIFVVISSKPPTPTLISSCCWLITVTVTTYLYMASPSGHNELKLDNANVLYAYSLPGDVSNQKLVGVCVSRSCNRLTAVLSNGAIINWDILQSNPSGYFTLPGSEIIIQSCLLTNDTLWIYNNNNSQRQLYIYLLNC